MALEIWADYHTHSRYSHGSGSVADNVRAGLARGLSAVGIADHGFRSLPGVSTTPRGLAAMQRDVATLNAQGLPVQALAGVECNIIGLDGRLDVPKPLLDKLDVVLAGLHPRFLPATWRDGWELVGMNLVAAVSQLARRRVRTANTKAVVSAVLGNDIDILTHPGWGLDIDTGELARACARRNTAMEINASHGHMTAAYCRLADRAGALFALGSDAHGPTDVGRLDAALAVAAAAGLRPEQVINAHGGPGLVRRKGIARHQGEAWHTRRL